MSRPAVDVVAECRLMPESVLQDRVVALARICGWEHYHTHRSDRSRAGYPDLTLWRPSTREHFYAELKGHTVRSRGRLSRAQRETIESLRAAGVEVQVWWPEHWWDGTIERRLARPSGNGR